MTPDRLERALKLAREWAKEAIRHRKAAAELPCDYAANEALLHEIEADMLDRCSNQLLKALKGDQ